MTTPPGSDTPAIWDWFNPVYDVQQFLKSLTSTAGKAVSNWFGSLGADIASGAETGFVVIIRDIWAVIAGPAYIIIGFLIIVIALQLFFLGHAGGSIAAAALAVK